MTAFKKERLLACWVGRADLQAADQSSDEETGPIARALAAHDFDRVLLLTNHPPDRMRRFVNWLVPKTQARLQAHETELPSPTDFGAIYSFASRVLDGAIPDTGAALTFHLSPGTSAMTAVWIILAKTRFPARLLESSREAGVRVASVPFDLSAEFLPDLLREPDARLGSLSEARPPESAAFEDIVHRSSSMFCLVEKAKKAALRSVPILLQGESGTGKELFARAIHRASPRRDKPFVPVNCGALPASLVDSQLFGHIKGSFTGADHDHKGFFAAADGGTLLLDELGELSLESQVKLLRVLQEGQIVPVGANRERRIDVRIIAATNRPLLTEVAEGRFREDLFYRLAVAFFELPPVREREGDLGLLIEHLLKRIDTEMKDDFGYERKELTPGARNVLLQHYWPGNVRELYNTLQRATLWSSGSRIDVEDVRQAILTRPDPFRDKILNRQFDEGFSLPAVISEVANHYLIRALDEAGRNKTKAAKLVGLKSYQTFDAWVKRHQSPT